MLSKIKLKDKEYANVDDMDIENTVTWVCQMLAVIKTESDLKLMVKFNLLGNTFLSSVWQDSQ